MACGRGGSLETKPGADTGFQSQSLKAAYYLKKAGYTNVSHVKVRTLLHRLPPCQLACSRAPVSSRNGGVAACRGHW